ncbi:MAG: HAD family hydrolase, partial [Eubacterium sp.]|nr:HAD family hydrolase [Eubacterium sp.]
MSVFENYQKKREFLVCIDSDGCAMDTMDCKHFHCFGPCMVDEWNLGEWKEPILDYWNQVNLYTMTRGINRFLALGKVLAHVNVTYRDIPQIAEFAA